MINRVLRAWMQAKAAQALDQESRLMARRHRIMVEDAERRARERQERKHVLRSVIALAGPKAG